jgi:aminopeptidase N
MKRAVFGRILVAILGVAIALSFAQKIDVSSRARQTERSRDYQALHYRIVLDLDPVKKSFTGETTVTLSPFRDDFKSCALDAQTFTVTSVKMADGTSLWNSQTPGGQLIVNFPKPYAMGDKIQFTVYYHAEKDLTDPQTRRKGINFVDAAPGNPAVIVARSFPDGARHWFPCYDHPNGKATQEVIATVPRDYRVLSNGKLIGTTESPDKKTRTFHWSQVQPHSTYLSALIAGPYIVTEDSLGALPIDYWYYEKDKADALNSFRRTPEIIKFLGQIYGYPYPWAKYDQIIVPGGGGTETTTATMLFQGTVLDAKADKDYPVHRWLITHEAAHHWWGDLVTCRDWGHTWINESFGTYSEVEYAAYEAGPDDAALDILGKRNRYLQEAATRYMRPIVFHRWEDPGQNFDRHTYQKGAAVVHMMRWILGEKPFRAAISHFLHKHAFQPADTNDLLTAIKEATGQNLDWFFDEWLLRPGHSIFNVTADWNAPARKLTWRIVQTQDTAAGIPYYRTPVVLAARLPQGGIEERAWISGRETVVTMDCAQKPLMVRFDAGDYLLKELTFERPVEELIYQLGRDDAMGRMWAAGQLGRHSDDPRVGPALIQCAKSDGFWAVRRDALYILGGFEGPIEIDERNNIPFTRLNDGYHPGKFLTGELAGFLKERAADPNARVRTAAFWALGNLRDRTLIPFLKERFAAEDSYAAQSAALVALGKTGDPALAPFLQEASRMKAHPVIKTAADWAIKELK